MIEIKKKRENNENNNKVEIPVTAIKSAIYPSAMHLCLLVKNTPWKIVNAKRILSVPMTLSGLFIKTVSIKFTKLSITRFPNLATIFMRVIAKY